MTKGGLIPSLRPWAGLRRALPDTLIHKAIMGSRVMIMTSESAPVVGFSLSFANAYENDRPTMPNVKHLEARLLRGHSQMTSAERGKVEVTQILTQ